MNARLIGYLAAGVLLLAVLILGPAMCNAYLAEKQAGHIAKGQNSATLDSIEAANSEAARIDDLETQVDKATGELADEVRAAPAGDSNDAADRAACKLKAYRDTIRCEQLRRKLGE